MQGQSFSSAFAKTLTKGVAHVLREENKSQAEIDSLLIEGLESGDAIPVTPEFWKELWNRVDSREQAGTVHRPDVCCLPNC